MFNVWLFPKWYPNREDPQLGVFIQKHARAIAKKNRVTVLYVHSISSLKNTFETEQNHSDNLEEIIIYFKKNTSIAKTAVNFLRYFKAIRKGLKILNTKSPNPDILHAYILLRPALIAWYLSKTKKIPYVISEQWSGYVTGKYASLSAFSKILSKNMVKNASAFTVVSNYLLEGMNRLGIVNKNTSIIPNCIEVSPAQKIKNTDQSVYVLIVADLVDEIKNISGVLRIISTLDEKIPFELHIIGHGRDEKMLKSLSAELNLERKVFFEGLRTNEEVYGFLHRCDFLVMNSNYETFSLICAESMSCGKPVLATRCGGPNEFVTDETGLLIEPEDQIELRKAFIYMLNNFNSFDSQKIISYANKLFSPEMASESFNNVFQMAVKEGK